MFSLSKISFRSSQISWTYINKAEGKFTLVKVNLVYFSLVWYLNTQKTNSDWIYSLLGLDGLTQHIFEFSLEIVQYFFHRFFERRYELSISSREPRRKTTHLNWKSIKFIQRGVYNNLWIELTRPYRVFGCGRPCCKQAHHVKEVFKSKQFPDASGHVWKLDMTMKTGFSGLFPWSETVQTTRNTEM